MIESNNGQNSITHSIGPDGYSAFFLYHDSVYRVPARGPFDTGVSIRILI